MTVVLTVLMLTDSIVLILLIVLILNSADIINSIDTSMTLVLRVLRLIHMKNNKYEYD